MEERGVEVDHSSLNRWVLKYAPLLDQAFRARKRRVGGSWRMDENLRADQGPVEVSVSGRVDKAGATVDFLLTARRDRKAALRFLCKAIGQNGVRGEDHHRQERGQHRGDRELQPRAGRREIELRQVSFTSTTLSNRTIERSSAKCDR